MEKYMESDNYERTELIVTKFDLEDVLASSGVDPLRYGLREYEINIL